MLKRKQGLAWLIVAALAPSGLAATAPDYARKATWPETMLAARAAYNSWLEREKLPRFAQPVEVDGWYVAESAAAGLGEKIASANVNLHARDKDERLVWRERPDLADGRPHRLSGAPVVTLYRKLYVREKEPKRVVLCLETDGGFAMWLQGRKVLAREAAAARGEADRGRSESEATLSPANNSLVVELRGGQQFQFSMLRGWPDGAWGRIEADFPAEAAWMWRDADGAKLLDWFASTDKVDIERRMLDHVFGDLGKAGDPFRKERDALAREKAPSTDPRWLDLYARACRYRDAAECIERLNTKALRLAIEDLAASFPEKYTRAADFLGRTDACERKAEAFRQALARGETPDPAAMKPVEQEFRSLQREALLANPLLDFGRLLLIKRRDPDRDTKYFRGLGLPNNWQGNCSLPRDGCENEIDVLSSARPGGTLTTLLKPHGDELIADVDLHWDADRMLFSMQETGGERRWQVWELKADGGDWEAVARSLAAAAKLPSGSPRAARLRQVTPDEPDVDNYDPCYLPDGAILFDSTAVIQGIPCVTGGDSAKGKICLCR